MEFVLQRTLMSLWYIFFLSQWYIFQLSILRMRRGIAVR